MLLSDTGVETAEAELEMMAALMLAADFLPSDKFLIKDTINLACLDVNVMTVAAGEDPLCGVPADPTLEIVNDMDSGMVFGFELLLALMLPGV